MYRRGLGSLLYLVNNSRPEVYNAVCELSNFMGESHMSHYKAFLCAINYVIAKIYYLYQMKS